jgi:metallo-beta-lactamase family protein
LLLYLINDLQKSGRIPRLPLFIDSPMAINAVPLYCDHTEEHDLTMRALQSAADCPIVPPNLRMMRSREESKSLNNLVPPAIIISASGMATGGRIVHHLRQRLGDTRNAVVLVGHQAQGTRGRYLQDGAREVEIYGKKVPVRAAVFTLSGLSAHADVEEILAWLGRFQYAPRQTWLVHGEPEAAAALAATIQERLRWEVKVAVEGAEVQVESGPSRPGAIATA